MAAASNITIRVNDGTTVLHEGRSRLVGSQAMISIAEPLRPNVPAAPRAGADLQAARERLGWPLHEVATDLKIRVAHLQALEAGDIARLPGNAYALGFVRTYAAALGLEPEEMVRRFKSEAAAVSQRIELDFPVPVPERGLPPGAVALLGLVLAIAVYAGWYRLSGEGRLPPETVAAVPERLAPLAEQALPPVMRPAEPVVVAAAPVAPTPDPAPVVPSISPSSAAAAPVIMPPPAARPAEDQPRIVVRASADAWISVRDKAGQSLLNRVLKTGETWPVPPGKQGLLLTTGNAGGTDLLVDGQPTAGLGGAGVVRRDLALDPDTIKDGKLALVAPPIAAPPVQPVANRR